MRLSLALFITLVINASPMLASELLTLKIGTFDTETALDARRILYEVYIQEENWQFEPGPSHIRVETLSDGGKILANDYDKKALFFVAYLGKQAVGTLRLAHTMAGKFEFEHYIPLPPFLDGFKAGNSSRLWEVNRLAIRRDYRQREFQTTEVLEIGVFPFLDQAVRHFAVEMGALIFAASNSRLGKVLLRGGDWASFGEIAKYNASDPNEVRIIFSALRPAAGEKAWLCELMAAALGA